jgi:hypothetical protein
MLKKNISKHVITTNWCCLFEILKIENLGLTFLNFGIEVIETKLAHNGCRCFCSVMW